MTKVMREQIVWEDEPNIRCNKTAELDRECLQTKPVCLEMVV